MAVNDACSGALSFWSMKNTRRNPAGAHKPAPPANTTLTRRKNTAATAASISDPVSDDAELADLLASLYTGRIQDPSENL